MPTTTAPAFACSGSAMTTGRRSTERLNGKKQLFFE
jgi:hypothetical protein